MLVSGDQSFLKTVNRRALMHLLRTHSGLSRADLAKRTGLTKSTVGTLTAELIEQGWVREGDAVASPTGRPSTPLFVDDGHLLILGAELGGDSRNVLALTASGRLLDRQFTHMDRDPRVPVPHPEEVVTQIVGDIDRLLQRQQRAGRRLIGLGLGVTGPVERGTDIMTVSPHWGWHNVPLREMFTPHLARLGLAHLPFLIANEANAAAMGEHVFGRTVEAGPLLYLSIGIGVGGGIIINDRLLDGQGGWAGEVGHMTLSVDGPRCPCGNQGCAEILIGQSALASALGRAHANIDEMRALLDAGDARAEEAVLRGGQWLGVLIANLVNVFNPSQVVVGGPLTELGDALLAPAWAEARRRALPDSLDRVTFTRCPNGRDASARGAAAYVMHEAFTTPSRVGTPA